MQSKLDARKQTIFTMQQSGITKMCPMSLRFWEFGIVISVLFQTIVIHFVSVCVCVCECETKCPLRQHHINTFKIIFMIIQLALDWNLVTFPVEQCAVWTWMVLRKKRSFRVQRNKRAMCCMFITRNYSTGLLQWRTCSWEFSNAVAKYAKTHIGTDSNSLIASAV